MAAFSVDLIGCVFVTAISRPAFPVSHPVSYTHLDVYKRQGSFSLDAETLENLLGMLGGGLNDGAALTPDGNLSLIDVYKRQAQKPGYAGDPGSGVEPCFPKPGSGQIHLVLRGRVPPSAAGRGWRLERGDLGISQIPFCNKIQKMKNSSFQHKKTIQK